MSTELHYNRLKEKRVQGRYVCNDHIVPVLIESGKVFDLATIGYSVQQRPIYSITLGEGPLKVFMWSQMHGNESTTTKSVLDLINFFAADMKGSKDILEKCTLKIIPILNPDGAAAYTRVNANEVDLNRDAKNRSQPESQVLRATYDDFAPDFCFNLHDQRTIYNVGSTDQPATLSFLAPAHDVQRSISETRRKAMRLIVAMNTILAPIIPGRIGRYDDTFNDNCVGDMFQMLNTPTLLFEAGHAPDDYDREQTRELLFRALIHVLETIAENRIDQYDDQAYFAIPENQKYFFDMLIRNVPVGETSKLKDVGILFSEVLAEGKINFEPRIAQEGNLAAYFGHVTYDFSNPTDRDQLNQLNLPRFR